MIEFIDNEDHCRWDGVLMSSEHNLKVMGIDLDEVYEIEGCTMVTGYKENERYIYAIDTSNITEAIILYLKAKTYTELYKWYENALDEEHGFVKKTHKQLICVGEDFYEDLRHIVLLKDHPEINVELCKEFSKAIKEYYAKGFN